MVSQWTPLVLDNLGVNGIEGLIGVEVLTDYGSDVIKPNQIGSRKLKKNKQLKKENQELTENSESYQSSVIKKKKSKAHKKKKALKNKKNVPKILENDSGIRNEWIVTDNTADKELEFESNDSDSEISERPNEHYNLNRAWPGVSHRLLKALRDQGFTQPTDIQALTLPPAILYKRNILGAAETGSGKTLAFGLPILQGILDHQEKLQDEAAGNSENEEAVNVDEAQKDDEFGCINISNAPNLSEVIKNRKYKKRKLYSVIFTPTRELAIQVGQHLKAAAKYTKIRIAVIVGGLSQDKQIKRLSKGPEIVIGTPGRLWELIHQGDDHLKQIQDIKYLVIDEADRMMEKGHFEELKRLIDAINQYPEKSQKRQTFIFSATLTMVHELPNRAKLKRKNYLRITPGQKLNSFINSLGIKDPKVIDVTKVTGTASTLTEARIDCQASEKDFYLYYFLQRHPGRTLVFCNSISCIKRLANLFGILNCSPLPLHANMMQKQRLKNLDQFRARPNGFLLATDVAARGLDIPDVEHVIHYQVPRTTESYVHRSGRTARAKKEGITVLFIDPTEIYSYTKLCKSLSRDKNLPIFPVINEYMALVKTRVLLAQEIDQLELAAKRAASHVNWLEKSAKEMDIILNEKDEFKARQNLQPQKSKLAAQKRKQLAMLTCHPIFVNNCGSNYSAFGKVHGANSLTAVETIKEKLKKFKK